MNHTELKTYKSLELFKKHKNIHNQLIKQDLPEELIDMVIEFSGDLTDTKITDIDYTDIIEQIETNEKLYWRMPFTWEYRDGNKNKPYYYCKCCNEYYETYDWTIKKNDIRVDFKKSISSMKLHLKSSKHYLNKKYKK